MKKEDFAKGLNNIKKGVSKYSPEILTGIGLVGMGATVVLAVKATPKAMRLIEEAKENSEQEEFTKIDAVKAGWKPYIPVAVTGVISATCFVGARTIGTKRTAALAAAYKISEKALHEYKDAVIDTIGEKKAQQVKEKVVENRLAESPVSEQKVIVTKKGETLFYDMWNDRYFTSDINFIRKAINELNRNMMYDMSGYYSLNEFYSKIGINESKAGDVLGWRLEDGLPEVELTAMKTEDEEPCLAIDFTIAPIYGYSDGY